MTAYILAPEALQDLRDIWDYIATEGSVLDVEMTILDKQSKGIPIGKRNKKFAVFMICSPIRGTMEGAMHHGL